MSHEYKFLHAAGFQISQARKVCKYVFEEFFFRAEIDNQNRMFNICIYEEIWSEKEQRAVNYKERFSNEFLLKFKNYWGGEKGWELVITKMEFNIPDI